MDKEEDETHPLQFGQDVLWDAVLFKFGLNSIDDIVNDGSVYVGLKKRQRYLGFYYPQQLVHSSPLSYLTSRRWARARLGVGRHGGEHCGGALVVGGRAEGFYT